MADHSEEIRRLEEMLNSGITSRSVDGVSATRDLEAVRRRLAELRATDDVHRRSRRPKMVPYRF